MTTETKSADSKEWTLEPESEYRFELDPGNTLAIKVCELNADQR
jgi:polyribonucleotide 5'-hydroxyl-kinase